MESRQVILAAMGPDRPGVMDEVSHFLLECGGRVLDSRSINLRGTFALLLAIAADERGEKLIRDGLPKLAEDTGIRAELREVGQQQIDRFAYRFTATGKDRVGTLNRVSHLLRVLNVNIEGIDTHVEEAAGEAMFRMALLLTVPRETPVAMLREYLQHLCEEVQVEWALAPI